MAKLGELRVDVGGSTHTVAVYDVGDLTDEWLRTGWPDGGGGQKSAVVAAVPASDAAGGDGSLRVHGPDGQAWALVQDVTTEVLLDDFEGDLSQWHTPTGGGWATYDTSYFDGGRAVAAQDSNGTLIGAVPALEAERGHTYSVQTRHYGATVNSFLLGAPDNNDPFGDCYALQVDSYYDGSFELVLRQNGSGTVLDEDTTITVPEDDDLTIWVNYGTQTITARLYNNAGTMLSEIAASDQTYTGGYLGLHDSDNGWYSGFDLLYKDPGQPVK